MKEKVTTTSAMQMPAMQCNTSHRNVFMFSRSPKGKAQAHSPQSHKSVIVDILRQTSDVVK